MKDDYNAPTTDTATKKMEYYPDILYHKAAICKHVTLPLYAQVLVEVVTNISILIHTETESSVWTGFRVQSANRIHELYANKLLKILLANFFAVEKTFSTGMVISYATRASVAHLADTGVRVTGICDFLKLFVNQATAASIRQLQTKVADLGFAASDENLNNSMFINHESLLSRLIRIKRGPDLRQQDPQASTFECKFALPQDWQSVLDLFLVEHKVLMKDMI